MIQRKAGNQAAAALAEVYRREDPANNPATNGPAAESTPAAPGVQASPPGPGGPGGDASNAAPAESPAGPAAAGGGGGGGPEAAAPAGAPGAAPGPANAAGAKTAGPARPVGGAAGVGTAGAPGAGPAAKGGPGGGTGGGDGGAALAAFKSKAGAAGSKLKKKQPSSTHVGQMQGAAKGPANEKIAGGKAAQVDDMDAAPPGTFNKQAFIAAVEKAIAANAPKNLEEADNMSDSGKMGKVKDSVQSQVGDGKKDAAGDVEEATEKPPDASRGEKKPVKAMPAMAKPRKPGKPGAAKAMPKKRPAAATDLSAPAKEVDGQMAAEDVTEEQLAQSEEPTFIGALDAKKEGDKHSKEAPGPVKAEEQQILGQAKAEAGAAEAQGLTQMTGAKQNAVGAVGKSKDGSKSKDEAARKKVADQIEQIYNKTQDDTKKILTGLDKKVDDTFTKGESAARQKFEQKHKKDFKAWKDKRYSGWGSGLKWAKDKLFGVPAEANRIFDKARKVYLAEMKGVISAVADVVATELNAAKARIAKGRTEVAEYVQSLPNDLKSVGADLADDVQAKFDQLDSDVDAKNEEMVQAVANKHKEATDAVDAKIEELKAANSGLWNKAKAAIAAVINTIKQLKQAIATALKSAAAAIGLIIKSPVKFLGNLIKAIKDGLDLFKARIKEHMINGVFSWLTGAAAGAGIEVPKSFDLKGIIGLVLSIMGATVASIRAKILKRLKAKFGPKADEIMGKVESGVEVIGAVVSEGPIALWKIISQKVTNIWALVVDKLKNWLITKVVMEGLKTIAAILIPGAGFIKAAMAIVDIVMWLWNNAARIADLIKTIAGSIKAIATGATAAASKKIEQVLVKMLPLAISFMASLLRLGDISKKIRSVVKAVQRPITKVINGVVDKAVGLGKKFLKTGLGKKLKAGYGKAKKKVKETFDKAKAKGEKAVQKVKKKIYGGDDSPEGKKERERLGAKAGARNLNKHAGKPLARGMAAAALTTIRVRRGLGRLDPVPSNGRWQVVASVDRSESEISEAKTGDKADSQTDGEELESPEVKELEALVGSSELVEKLSAHIGDPAQLLGFVKQAGSGNAAELLSLMNLLASRSFDPRKAEKILRIANGNADKFSRLFVAVRRFPFPAKVAPNSPIPTSISSGKYSIGSDKLSGHRMKHYLERHVDVYFDFNQIKAKNTLWPANTSSSDVASQVDEALAVAAEAGDLVPGKIAVFRSYTLPSGLKVRMMVQNMNNQMTLGSFHPLAGSPGVVTFSRQEMEAFRSVVTGV